MENINSYDGKQTLFNVTNVSVRKMLISPSITAY